MQPLVVITKTAPATVSLRCSWVKHWTSNCFSELLNGQQQETVILLSRRWGSVWMWMWSSKCTLILNKMRKLTRLLFCGRTCIWGQFMLWPSCKERIFPTGIQRVSHHHGNIISGKSKCQGAVTASYIWCWNRIHESDKVQWAVDQEKGIFKL